MLQGVRAQVRSGQTAATAEEMSVVGAPPAPALIPVPGQASPFAPAIAGAAAPGGGLRAGHRGACLGAGATPGSRTRTAHHGCHEDLCLDCRCSHLVAAVRRGRGSRVGVRTLCAHLERSTGAHFVRTMCEPGLLRWWAWW